MLSSASLEVVPSKVQVRPAQVDENRATGGSLTGGASSVGRSRIVHIAAAVAVALAVPTTPPVFAGVPAVTACPGSLRSAPKRGVPVPVVVARAISVEGAVHWVVVWFLSVQ